MAYVTGARNLAPGTDFPGWKLLLYDRVTKETTYISPDTGSPLYPVLSANGRFIAYSDGSSDWTIDVYDRQTDTTTFASVNGSGAPANGASMDPSISASGRLVAFRSTATNLTPRSDTNGVDDIFIHNMETGKTSEVSLNSRGRLGNRSSGYPSLSATGRYVAFESWASNLVGMDTNGDRDIFVRDRREGVTRRVSVGSDGRQADAQSCCPSISGDGLRIEFWSNATNLVPGGTSDYDNVFVRDLAARDTTLVSVDSAGSEGNGWDDGVMISADGGHAVFSSTSSNLVPDDTNGASDVFIRGPLP